MVNFFVELMESTISHNSIPKYCNPVAPNNFFHLFELIWVYASSAEVSVLFTFKKHLLVLSFSFCLQFVFVVLFPLVESMTKKRIDMG